MPFHGLNTGRLNFSPLNRIGTLLESGVSAEKPITGTSRLRQISGTSVIGED
jgi:hypothetical protein